MNGELPPYHASRVSFQLYSRNIFIAPHCNLSDPKSIDVLTTACHTLLSSTLKTWSLKESVTTDEFVAFLQSVLEGLPSSSSSNSSANAALFGDILVDVIWSIDAELDEVLFDAKVHEGSGRGMHSNLPKDHLTNTNP